MTSQTTAHLAGQSIMLRFPGPELTPSIRESFRRIHPGGVILFGDNITSRSQLHTRCSELQAEAKLLGIPPLLIAIDQEAGLVSRLNADPDFVTPPGPMALSASGSSEDIRRAARITGEQLAEAGINVNFAPVVDINNNHANPVIRTRSFGDEPATVIAGSRATIEGLHEAGIAATVKHFPGHGDTNIDSHLGLPVIDRSLDHLRANELAPFQAAIDIGIAGVMTSHIVFPVFDELPATLSHRILTGLLRNEMGFEGVIFTDSMSMNAINDRYGHADSTLRAKTAGVDMLEANESLEIQEVRHQTMVDAIDSGRIDRDLFTRTATRIESLRERFHISYDASELPPASPQRQLDAVAIAGRCIAALGPAPFVPLDPNARGVVLDFQRYRGTEAEDPVHRGSLFRHLATERFPELGVVTLPHEPDGDDVQQALAATDGVSLVIIMTRDATDNPSQIEIANQVVDRAAVDARIVHVALRGPYDLGLVARATDRLATFGDPAVTLTALANVLAGDIAITGTNPLRHWTPQPPA